MRDDGKGPGGTDETIVASSTRTVGAAAASLRPASGAPREDGVADRPDYADLVEVDPGHYRMGGELARGGMGRIVMARDRRLGRRVAIKQLLHEDPAALVRFEREARITARLEHPSIVAVHEAGRWPSGEPFYAMKLISGRPLDTCIAAADTLAERLALLGNVIAAVNALAYAHSQRVIHRDLKPANVLVGDYGETVVIDWGLAKDLATRELGELSSLPPRDEPGSSGHTVDGAVIGTPAYMPPEQAAGDTVDERADVYALGALLYHVLAGTAPYIAKTTTDVLALVLAGPPAPIVERAPDAPADLIAIAEKAMARDPAQRFPNASEMAGELERFQMGQLVTSRRYTSWELLTRWVRRYRAAVTVGAIAIATLLTLGTFGVLEIVAQRGRAEDRAAEARIRADDGAIVRAHALLDSDPTRALAVLRELSPGSPNWRAARVIAADALERGIADVLHGQHIVRELAVSPDGSQLAAYEEDTSRKLLTLRGIRLWDLRTLTQRYLPAGDHVISDLALTGDGRIVTADYHGRVARIDPARGTFEQLYDFGGDYRGVALSPGARHLAMFNTREPSIVADLATGTTRVVGSYAQGAWSPDGAVLAVHDRHAGTVDRYELATGRITPLGGSTAAVAIATDGRRAWIGEMFGARQVTPDMKPPDRVNAPLDVVSALAVLRDGRIVTVHSHNQFRSPYDSRDIDEGDNSVTVRDGAATLHLVGHDADLDPLVQLPDGRIATGDRRGEVRVWRLPQVERRRGDGATTIAAATMTGDRRELVVTKRGPALEVHDLASRRVRRIAVTDAPAGFVTTAWSRIVSEVGDRKILETTQGPSEHVVELVRSRAGRRLVTVDEAKHAVVWDLDANTGRMLPVQKVEHVAISADGRQVVTVIEDPVEGALEQRRIQRWSVAGGAAQRDWTVIRPVTAVAMSADGTEVAISTTLGAYATLLSSIDDQLAAPDDLLRVLVFSPDGRYLVGAGDHATIYVWDLASRTTSRVLLGHSGTIPILAFSPDGQSFASTAGDKTIRVWDLRDGSARTLRGHTGFVRTIEWSSDGELLLTASDDRTAWLWDPASGRGRALRGHEDKVYAGFSADRRRLVVVDHFAEIAIHRDDLPRDELMLRGWLNTVARDGR